MTRFPIPNLRVAVRAAVPFIVMLAATHAFALPFDTKTPGIADTLEINTSVEHERSAAERGWEIPLEIVVPVTPWMEAGIEQKFAIAKDSDGTHYGFKDMEVAGKIRLLNGTDNAWGLLLGMKPTLKLPTGARRVSDHAWGLELPVFAGRKFDRTGVYAQTVYKHTFGLNKDRVNFSTLITQDLSKTFVIGGELQSKMPTARTAEYTLEANAGFSWRMTDHVKLQGLVGRTLRTPNGAPVKTVQMEFKFNF